MIDFLIVFGVAFCYTSMLLASSMLFRDTFEEWRDKRKNKNSDNLK